MKLLLIVLAVVAGAQVQARQLAEVHAEKPWFCHGTSPLFLQSQLSFEIKYETQS